jgi:cation diffusion facilitator CzcD-associated flavoprotein CzcO
VVGQGLGFYPGAGVEMSVTSVIIIGAGMSGICMAIKLRERGIDDVLILEKSAAAGGTWHDNTYPGACCDIASHLYSFSFEPWAEWSKAFAPQSEIQAYFEHCVDKYQLASLIRYKTQVESADFNEETGEWLLCTSTQEQLRCKVLISGVGQLNQPHIPQFAGAAEFKGLSFHSARWDHSVDLRGKRVAVIGNAASAIQFIPPVAEQADQVFVYQRSPNYIVPRNDRPYGKDEQQRYRDHPWLLKLSRLRWYLRQELLMFGAMLSGSLRQKLATSAAQKYLEQKINEPDMRQQLTPDYPLGCKRILVSDDYYQALAGDSVELVTSPIQGMDADGVLSEDEQARPVDVIIYATGFCATDFLATLEVRGKNGQLLSEQWAEGAEALRGVAVPEFPNLFLLYGPNTNLGHNSIIFMVEAQVRYLVQCIDKIIAHDLKTFTANAAASATFNEELQSALAETVWGGECGSWYKNEAGKITNNWPHSSLRFALSMRAPDFTEYDMDM